MHICTQSGTHWLASIISESLYPGYATGENEFWADLKARVTAVAFFHDFPIIWLLPEAHTGETAGFANNVFQSIDEIPTNVTRIFLSHMPTIHFEFDPTPYTKIIYLMREPHSVWRSMLQFKGRLRKVLNQHYADNGVDPSEFLNETIDPTEFVHDFLDGTCGHVHVHVWVCPTDSFSFVLLLLLLLLLYCFVRIDAFGKSVCHWCVNDTCQGVFRIHRDTTISAQSSRGIAMSRSGGGRYVCVHYHAAHSCVIYISSHGM